MGQAERVPRALPSQVRPDDFDWFKRGVWLACDAMKRPLILTCASTPIQAQERLVHEKKRSATQLYQEGWRIVEFHPK